MSLGEEYRFGVALSDYLFFCALASFQIFALAGVGCSLELCG